MRYIRSFLLLVLNIVFLLCEQVSHGVTVQTAHDKRIIINIESLTTPLPPQIAYYVSNKYRDMNVTAIRMALLAKQTYVPYKNHNYDQVADSVVAAQKNHRVIVTPKGRGIKYAKTKKYRMYKRSRPKIYIRQKAPVRNVRSSGEHEKYRRQKNDFGWHHPEDGDDDTALRASTKRLKDNHLQMFQKEGRYPYNIEPDDTSETSEREPLYGMVSAHNSIPKKKKKTWRSRGKYVVVKKNTGRNALPNTKLRAEYQRPKKEEFYISHDTVPRKYRSRYIRKKQKKSKVYPKSHLNDRPMSYLLQQQTPYLPDVHDFILYLTKLNKTQAEATLDDESEDLRSDQKERFEPSHFLFTVRKSEKAIKKPTQRERPSNIKQHVVESGGHTVYTEDGYEDQAYDHASENMDGTFDHGLPKRRSIQASYFNPFLSKRKQTEHSSRKPLTHRKRLKKSRIGGLPSTNADFQVSPINYIESTQSFGTIKSPMFYYKTKQNLDDCGQPDAITFTTRNKTVISNTSSQTKRLNNLGEKIHCYRNKFFGKDPLNNKIFREELINGQEFDIGHF